MITTYFKLALRNLWKFRVFSAINMIGLSIGIAICILVLLYVQFTMSIDTFHPEGNTIYRANIVYPGEDGLLSSIGLNTFDGANLLSDNFAEVKQILKVRPMGDVLARIDGKSVQLEKIVLTDSNFFDFFGYQLLAGNPATVLREPNKIVIDKSYAEKLFGNSDPIGKRITVFGSIEMDLEIVGVAESNSNSHMEFSILMPFSSTMANGMDFVRWYQYSIYLYAKLHSSSDVKVLEKKLADHISKESSDEENYTFQFQPLHDIYLGSSAIKFTEAFKKGNRNQLNILVVTGLLILLIAAVNYININTARSAERSKEVGIKKSLGVSQGHLVWQFMAESFLTTFFAAVLSLLIADLSLPFFNDVVQVQLGLTSEILLPLLLITLLLTFLSGLYPALIMASFNPINALKGRLGKSGKAHGRKVLIAFQFVITIMMIAGAVIIHDQLNFVNQMDLGFKKNDLISIRVSASQNISSKSIAFKSAIGEIPGVKEVSRSTDIIGQGATNNSGEILVPSTSEEILTTIFMVDHSYVQTYGLDLLQGRNFNSELASDSSGVIINEEFLRRSGLTDPIGKTLDLFNSELKIIGVVKNFHFSGLHDAISPTMLTIARFNLWNISVRFDSNSANNVLANIGNLWDEIEQDVPFEYTYVDQLYDRYYNDDTRLSNAISVFSFVSIMIAAFGLLGLVSHTLSVRQKEIGIRKLHGASIQQVVVLISKKFLLLASIALIVAIPLTVLAANYWLDLFAYRIQIGWTPFVISGVVAIGTLLLTVAIQSVTAAAKNPAKVLNHE